MMAGRAIASGMLGMVTVLLGARSVSAATYHIAASGGSDDAAGSSGAPWATFAHAFSRMDGGDVLLVKDGTYAQEIRDVVPVPEAAIAHLATQYDG